MAESHFPLSHGALPSQAACWHLPPYFFSLACGASDFATSIAIVALAHFAYEASVFGVLAPPSDVLSVSVAVGSVFVATQLFRDSYAPDHYLNVARNFKAATRGWFITFFILAWIAFLMKATEDYSRAALTMSFCFGLLGTLVLRAFLIRVFNGALSRSRVVFRRAFVIYAPENAEDGPMPDESRYGVRIVGSTRLNIQPGSDHTAQCHAAIQAAFRTYQNSPYDEIRLILGWTNKDLMMQLRSLLAAVPVRVVLAVNPLIGPLSGVGPLNLVNNSGIDIQRPPLTPGELAQKRALDTIFAGAALILLAPLMLFVALALKAEGRGPVIFRQKRKGFGGRQFTILKFRTMTVLEDGEIIEQARDNDPRVTRLGAMLRRTSIDELPQLWNVLRGDMSIVGPRPHALAHDSYYDQLIASYAHRHHVKPGLTGWAQVHGLRGETRELTKMADRVTHDLWYISHWSIWLDLQIIARTAFTVLAHRAY